MEVGVRERERRGEREPIGEREERGERESERFLIF